MVIIFSVIATEDTPEEVVFEEILEGRMEPVVRRDGRTYPGSENRECEGTRGRGTAGLIKDSAGPSWTEHSEEGRSEAIRTGQVGHHTAWPPLCVKATMREVA